MENEVIDLGQDEQAQPAVIDLGQDAGEVVDLGEDEPSLMTPPIKNLAKPDEDGSAWNRATEALSGAAGAVLGPVFEGIDKAADFITGRTPEEKEKEGRAAMSMQVGKQTIPSWDRRIVEAEKIRELEAQGDKLTKAQRAELAVMKDMAARASKIAPLPKAPKTPSNTAGMAANITDEEVGAIAHQYGADTNWLLSRLAREGVTLESTQAQIDAGESGQSFIGQISGWLDAAAGMGGGKYFDRATASPENRRALEAIRRIANARFGGMRLASEIAGGIPFGMAQGMQIVKLANMAKLPASAAVGADVLGSGAIIGLTQSEKQDSPLAAAGKGALIGTPFLGLGPATAGAGKLTKAAMSKFTSAANRMAQSTSPHAFQAASEKAALNGNTRLTQMIRDASAGVANDDARMLAAKAGMADAASADDAAVSKYLFDDVSGAFTKAPDETRQTFQRALTDQYFDEELAVRIQANWPGSYLGRVLDTFGSAPQTAAVYDARHGTNGMQTLDALGTALRVSGAMADTYGAQFQKTVLEPIHKRKHLVPELANLSDDAALIKVYDMIDSGNAPQHMQDVVANVAKFYEDIRQEVNAVKQPGSQLNTVNIIPLAGDKPYVPHMVKQGIDKAVALENRVGTPLTAIIMNTDPAKLISGVPGLRGDFDRLGVTKVLGLLEGKTPGELNNWSTAEVVQAFQKHASVGRVQTELQRTAESPTMLAALQQRTGEIPDWFREKNLAKVTGNYITDALHQVFVEPHMRDIEQLKNVMLKSNDPNGAQFYDGWLKQMRRGDSSNLGVAGSVGAGTRKIVNMWKHNQKLKAAQAEANGAKDSADVANMLAQMPEKALAQIRHNMYSAFLGIPNAKAVVENVAQPLTMGLPQLGGPYGASVVARAMAEQTPVQQMTKGGRTVMYEQGKEFQQLLRGELQKQGLTGKVAEQASQLGLLAFNMTEKWSRDTAMKMGSVIARDLMAGKPAAIKFMEGMPGSYGRSVAKALQAGDKEGVETLLTNFTSSRLALDYSKAAQSEFARSLGPVFSSFQRWPAESIGMVNQALRGREYGTNPVMHAIRSPAGGHVKLFAAMLLSEKMFETAKAYDDAKKENEAYSYLTGGKGVAGFSPVTMPFQFATGSKYKSSLIEMLINMISAGGGKFKEEITDADTAEANLKLQRALDSGLSLALPGMWMFKLGDAADRLVDGELMEKARGPVQRWQESQ